MSHWTEREFVSLDFETTGVDTSTARPVEVALICLDSTETKNVSHFLPDNEGSTIINIDEEIPEEAAKIHGITTERMRREGKPARAVTGLLVMAVDYYVRERTPLIIFNVPYDWNILLNEAKKHNFELEGVPLFLDPLLLDRHFDKYRKGLRQLTTVSNYYNVSLDGKAHSAAADALAAAKVMRRMIKRYPFFKAVSLEELQELQATWYEEWKTGIHKYWASQGKLDQKVTAIWPSRKSENKSEKVDLPAV